MKSYKIVVGDNLEALREMPDESVDSIVTDPPYGFAFMNKRWDYDVPGIETWRECLRVLKPGGHLLAFGGARTYHRLVIPIEDAGFEIRDQILWLYGSGFPKSHNVSKAIDKAAGAEREIVGVAGKSGSVRNSMLGDFAGGEYMDTAPATPDAQKWDGWGTALKPAHEPIVMARKPFKGTVAANVLEHGTGAINIDGCRVAGPKPDTTRGAGGMNGRYGPIGAQGRIVDDGQGRFPANLIHDGSEAVLGVFPKNRKSGAVLKEYPRNREGSIYGGGHGFGRTSGDGIFQASEGSAARYFYCAKASKRDRDEGLEARNIHPTVKPTDLMRYLVRLVTPPGGVVLDPFAGSGSTGKAAILEGFRFVGLELDPAYAEIAEARCAHATAIGREGR